MNLLELDNWICQNFIIISFLFKKNTVIWKFEIWRLHNSLYVHKWGFCVLHKLSVSWRNRNIRSNAWLCSKSAKLYALQITLPSSRRGQEVTCCKTKCLPISNIRSFSNGSPTSLCLFWFTHILLKTVYLFCPEYAWNICYWALSNRTYKTTLVFNDYSKNFRQYHGLYHYEKSSAKLSIHLNFRPQLLKYKFPLRYLYDDFPFFGYIK